MSGLSCAEFARQAGLSRQGVHDALRYAKAGMVAFGAEQKLIASDSTPEATNPVPRFAMVMHIIFIFFIYV